jgi:hypothetical protein
MQEMHKKKLIVVLGMHRSGTSAVTRSLKTLGVDLGDALIPAVAGDNDKGFWEDADTLSINQDLMAALGVIWCPLSPYDWSKIDAGHLQEFQRQAVELLETKLRNVDAFGIKDPRLTRLLMFWRPVFERLCVDVRYVLVVRNPLSVAASLKHRNGFSEFRSLLLWLRHVVPSFLETFGLPRVVVSYERLMADPKRELRRIAASLEVSFDEHSDVFADYAKDFLSPELQHAHHTARDLEQAKDGMVFRLKQIYEALDGMASDRMQDNDTSAHELFLNVDRYLADMADSLIYIDQLEERNDQLMQLVSPTATDRLAELEIAYDKLTEGQEWLSSQRDAWERLAAERQERITELLVVAEECKKGNDWLESERQAWERHAKELQIRVEELSNHTNSIDPGASAERE